jgi:hypothetical protein
MIYAKPFESGGGMGKRRRKHQTSPPLVRAEAAGVAEHLDEAHRLDGGDFPRGLERIRSPA